MRLVFVGIGLILCAFLASCAPYCPPRWVPHALIPEDFRFKSHVYGNIKNGVYSTHIGRVPGRGTFSLIIPQFRNRHELIFTDAKEFWGNDYTYVTFGPTPSDRNIYHAYVSLKYGEPLWLFRDRKYPPWVEKAERGYYRMMDKIYEERTFICDRPAIYTVYVQRNAGYYNYIGMWQPGAVTFTHSVYTIDYGRYAVMLWIQSSSGSGFDIVNDDNRYQVIQQIWEPQIRFLRSFELYPQWRGVDCKRPLICHVN